MGVMAVLLELVVVVLLGLVVVVDVMLCELDVVRMTAVFVWVVSVENFVSWIVCWLHSVPMCD